MLGRANLDVIFPRQVSVWVGASAVDGHGLPLRGRSRIVGTGPLSVLHLDSVKRWSGNCAGLEPHRGDETGWHAEGCRHARRSNRCEGAERRREGE